MTDKGKTFRQLHERPGAFILPNPPALNTRRA